MTSVRFTPRFEGDEYHGGGLHCSHKGVFEVEGTQAEYLVSGQSKRFSLANTKAEQKDQAPIKKTKKGKK